MSSRRSALPEVKNNNDDEKSNNNNIFKFDF